MHGTALSVHTIYFWPDPLACLLEACRVLCPGARFVLGCTPKDSPRAASFPVEVYAFYSQQQVRALLSAAAFGHIELYPHGHFALAVARAV